jgi:hypothetical protein
VVTRRIVNLILNGQVAIFHKNKQMKKGIVIILLGIFFMGCTSTRNTCKKLPTYGWYK